MMNNNELAFARLLILMSFIVGCSCIAYGEPNPATPNPCLHTKCSFGARCIVLPNGRAECECPTICPMIYSPVCGSDKKTYTNKCFLRVAACLEKKNITIAYYGECIDEIDACSTVRCGYGARCRVNKNGRATCECPSICPTIYQPVYGSDGEMYPNKCALEIEACKQKKDITVVRQGGGDDEDQGDDTCKSVTCQYGAICVPQLDGQASCVCNKACSKIYRPICGTNGKTYSNKCVMESEICENQEPVRVRHEGVCEEEEQQEIEC